MTRGDGVVSRVVGTQTYLVQDAATAQGVFVFAQTIAAVKSVYTVPNNGPTFPAVGGTVLNFGISRVASKPATIFLTSAGGTFVANNNFNFNSIRMSGKEAKLLLRKGQLTPSLLPRTLLGSFSLTSGAPSVNDGTFSLSYDQARTQRINATNGANSLADGVNDVLGFFDTPDRVYGVPTP